MSGGLIVDLFAGGGGASLALEAALRRKVDIAVNHDPKALAMHRANHPNTRHFCEDVFTIDPREATGGRPVDVMWCSPDCTHFSKAKGGKPREKKIRSLAWAVLKWAALTRPRVLFLENVGEFADWGPLTRSKRPCKRRRGMTFEQWISQFRDLGYEIEWREIKACDYGAPTIRKRLFLVARRDGLPIVRPAPTHGPEGSRLKPYHTAAEIIDWSIPCPSIFERKRPLAEATLRRIARGIRKFVIEAEEPFIVTYYGAKSDNDFRGQGLNEPLKTQTTENRHALVTPDLARIGQTGGNRAYVNSLDDPLTTITTKAEHLLVAPLLSRQFGQGTGRRADGPAPTTTAGGAGKTALVAAFLAKHYGGMTGVGVDTPLSTVTARGTQNQVVTSHLIKLKGTCRDGQPVSEPLHTVQAGGLHYGEVRAFLMKYYGTGGQWQDCRDPLHTLTAKARMGLVTVAGEDYRIADIGMRMLAPRELYRAQGFPEDYSIDPLFEGKCLTKTDQVRMCGNSVCPDVAEAVIRANVAGILEAEDAA